MSDCEAADVLEEDRRRHQIRRRALPAGRRGEFDRRLLAGEDISRLARIFGIELWYAQRRAKRVLARAALEAGDQTAEAPRPAASQVPALSEHMTPTEYACSLLGARVWPLRGGYYMLDGYHAGPREVTRAANRLLRERGLAEIPYPGLVPLQRGQQWP
ncbi:hypothetical protein [Belnapia moabensis]|uniref:hypothetical protein n=1 Tax=Belnapia moabensis TaxID=365533 RepID=UPI0005BA5894|nr:hypothetical protein [Belnapia moabensis]